MLIKLTGVPHPDINGGQSWPIYVDPTRVLFITRTRHQRIKMMNVGLRRELYDDLWGAAERLNQLLQKKWPTEIDNQQAAAWAKDLHMAGHVVTEASNAWSRAYRADDFHEEIECTEVQLACGTALEHGVMLARMWCMEQPDEVADSVLKGMHPQTWVRDGR